MARELIKEHGLTGWRFEWDNATSRLGLCSYAKRTIQLSRKPTFHRPESDVRLTILHEIAHALVGGRNGHNDVWRAKCYSIGGDGKRCGAVPQEAVAQIAPWVLICPNCNKKSPRHRKTATKYACGACVRRFGRSRMGEFYLRWASSSSLTA